MALTQAAGFVRATGSTLAGYAELYQARSADLFTHQRPADYPDTVATTWQLAIERLPGAAQTLLRLLAFCAPDRIPLHLLLQPLIDPGKLGLPATLEVDIRPLLTDALACHRAIGELRAHSLVTPTEHPTTITIHRLVQAVTRHHIPTPDTWAQAAHTLLDAALPSGPATLTTLTTWHQLRTHAHAITAHRPADHPDTLGTRHYLAHWTGRRGMWWRRGISSPSCSPIVNGCWAPTTPTPSAPGTPRRVGWAGGGCGGGAGSVRRPARRS